MVSKQEKMQPFIPFKPVPQAESTKKSVAFSEMVDMINNQHYQQMNNHQRRIKH